MRISDWSSDVCSSDLVQLVQQVEAGHRRHGRTDAALLAENVGVEIHGDDHLLSSSARQTDTDTGTPKRAASTIRDRKSVVSGKSESVRVNLGGRRSIKKKKNI